MTSGRTGHQLWGGRFQAGPAASLDELNRSLPIDYRLWPQDLQAARAWAVALAGVGVVTADEQRQLLDGLDKVEEQLADGAGVGAPDEDVHTLVERLLHEQVGAVALKLNTGRSRNDQVATDVRLWMREACAAVEAEVSALGLALVRAARAGADMVLPGYTHGQRAQPVRWGYVLAAHAWPLVRDRTRLRHAAAAADALPLGSGAIAGSGVPVDRDGIRSELGFSRLAANALDVTGDRDCLLDALFAMALIALHVSRLATEVILYASSEYGFVRLADEFCTGSSLMPQKRNPDVFELARAKAARTLGDLVGLLVTVKGLPAGYAKDLQEDKVYLFDAVDTMLLTLPAVRGAVETMRPVPERMRGALDEGVLATDLADGLVGHGVPFRRAHALVGQLVRDAEARALGLSAVPAAMAAALHPALPELLANLGSWEDSIERRPAEGGSSGAALARQLSALEDAFAAATPAPV